MLISNKILFSITYYIERLILVLIIFSSMQSASDYYPAQVGDRRSIQVNVRRCLGGGYIGIATFPESS